MRRIKLWKLSAAFLLAGFLQSHGQVINLQPDCVVDGASIRLRDLLIPGSELPNQWGGRVIADAPPSGSVCVLSLSQIATVLHGYEDMGAMILRGHPEIRVTSRTQTVDFDALDCAIDAYLAGKPDWQGRRLRVCRDQIPVSKVITGALEVEIEGLFEQDGDRPLQAAMVLRVDGRRIPERGPLMVPLVELHPFWVVVHPLQRGDVIRQEDVEVQWVLIPEGGSRYYPESEPITGMEVRRNLQVGALPVLGSLAAPTYAKRGEMVRVTATRGGLVVTLRAKALSDGRRDERISCVNEASGRRMYVRLIGVHEAVLDDGGSIGS